MQSWPNIQKSTNIIHLINKTKNKKQISISIDAEKAFNKINTSWRQKIISKQKYREIFQSHKG